MNLAVKCKVVKSHLSIPVTIYRVEDDTLLLSRPLLLMLLLPLPFTLFLGNSLLSFPRSISLTALPFIIVAGRHCRG